MNPQGQETISTHNTFTEERLLELQGAWGNMLNFDQGTAYVRDWQDAHAYNDILAGQEELEKEFARRRQEHVNDLINMSVISHMPWNVAHLVAKASTPELIETFLRDSQYLKVAEGDRFYYEKAVQAALPDLDVENLPIDLLVREHFDLWKDLNAPIGKEEA